jgi:hypothetical protein
MTSINKSCSITELFKVPNGEGKTTWYSREVLMSQPKGCWDCIWRFLKVKNSMGLIIHGVGRKAEKELFSILIILILSLL